MPRKSRNPTEEVKATAKNGKTRISLRELAEHLGLSPTALSFVLNDAPAASSIPQETKDRIFAAAAEFNYRPNYFARSLRAQRSFTFGVLIPEVSDGYSSMVLSGIENALSQNDYFHFSASHRHRDKLISEYIDLFIERGVEGIIAVDTVLKTTTQLPIVTVSGHDGGENITNVVLNHYRAAEIAFGHLIESNHRRIAFIKGQQFSSDTDVRWKSICKVAARNNIEINPELVAQLEGDTPSPEPGFVATKKILAARKQFTALFAFNDISAIGAIRALQESGLRVPEDVSVLGFDDIYYSAFHNPTLTTIRQPLFEMGKLAAQTLLKRTSGKTDGDDAAKEILVEPELVIRKSTRKI
ncbi:MAG: LacI family DNA-binding transcriptional regulator [Pyrinomonadaceae bacterium]|nr:LacI family DNA-binding transcriptional regulator [Pyrinomonadaceae bacterium]